MCDTRSSKTTGGTCLSTEKTVWEKYLLGISQRSPNMIGNIVCYAPPRGYDESLAEWPERARLICAAPDLLAACELFRRWRADGSDIWLYRDVQPAIEAAVAKATGAGELVGLPSEPEPYAEPKPIDTSDCPCCAETPTEQGPVLSEGGPALKEWWISADDGEVLCLTAESIGITNGDLCLWRGDELVARVAAGRWIAYWEDGTGNHFDA